MKVRGLAHSLFVCTGMLKMAAFLVPRAARAEWLEEWRAELWHVWHICNQNDGPAALHQKEEITAFSLGAFKDALWLRRNHASCGPRRWFRQGMPSRCILTFAVLAVASVLIALDCPRVWKVVQPNPYRDASDLVMVSRGGFESASYPTVEFSEYEAWSAKFASPIHRSCLLSIGGEATHHRDRFFSRAADRSGKRKSLRAAGSSHLI